SRRGAEAAPLPRATGDLRQDGPEARVDARAGRRAHGRHDSDHSDPLLDPESRRDASGREGVPDPMKVTVVAGAFHRANQGVYGSESQAAVLAKGFLKAGHDVTFIAAAGSDPVGKFRTVPCMYAQLYPNEEKFGYEWYKDELVGQDLIIDWSGTHRVTENMYFWERARFKGVLVWSHQGNVFSSPRGPPLYTYHGTVVSQAQKDHALANPFFS